MTTLQNKFIVCARKLYHPLGFRKGYNFPLWFITCGALLGFALSRFMYYNFDEHFLHRTIPGEQMYFRSGLQRVGMIIHLAAYLPAIVLVIFQFVPAIRYKALLFHRLNGYVCISLLLIGNVGGFMITRTSLGGAPDVQTYVGVIGALSTFAIIMAYINVKTLQIDQHRAWMMRAWAWPASIISMRLVMMAARRVIDKWYIYYASIECAQITFMYEFYANLTGAQNPTNYLYAHCTTTPSAVVAVSTRDTYGIHGPENIAAMYRVIFSLSGWIALLIHMALLELYFALTPSESARLRKLSYEKQVKAGFRFAEKGSMTATRFGDAPPGWNGPESAEKYIKAEDSGSDSDIGRTSNVPKNVDPAPVGQV